MSDTHQLTSAEIAYRDKEHALDLLARIKIARAAFELKPADLDSEVSFRFDAIKGMLDIAHADAFNMAQLWTREYKEIRDREEQER